MAYVRLLILICVLATLPAHAQTQQFNAGFMRMTTTGKYVVPVAVWYPTSAPEVDWEISPERQIHATIGAPISAGLHPLIILSHGSGGSEFGHTDLAETLARRGYIVAAPRHLGDSFDQPEGRGSAVQLVGRPWQAVATIDAVLADKKLAVAIDPARIGMAGFSAGGYTTMVMAGAKPDFSLFGSYCQAHPDDKEICEDAAGSRRANLTTSQAMPDDKRIKAAVAMAPLSIPFDAKGVANITIPLRIYRADNDQLLRNQWNTDHLISLLPASTEHAALPGGHYVFLAPCNDVLKAEAPAICDDGAGIDRNALHIKLDAEIADFFDRTL